MPNIKYLTNVTLLKYELIKSRIQERMNLLACEASSTDIKCAGKHIMFIHILGKGIEVRVKFRETNLFTIVHTI